jgi:hypothetical protein
LEHSGTKFLFGISRVLRRRFRDYVDFSDFSFAVIVNLDLVVGWLP